MALLGRKGLKDHGRHSRMKRGSFSLAKLCQINVANLGKNILFLILGNTEEKLDQIQTSHLQWHSGKKHAIRSKISETKSTIAQSSCIFFFFIEV